MDHCTINHSMDREDEIPTSMCVVRQGRRPCSRHLIQHHIHGPLRLFKGLENRADTLCPLPSLKNDRGLSKVSTILSHSASSLELQVHATTGIDTQLTMPKSTESHVIVAHNAMDWWPSSGYSRTSRQTWCYLQLECMKRVNVYHFEYSWWISQKNR